jgi:hypothetical protein
MDSRARNLLARQRWAPVVSYSTVWHVYRGALAIHGIVSECLGRICDSVPPRPRYEQIAYPPGPQREEQRHAQRVTSCYYWERQEQDGCSRATTSEKRIRKSVKKADSPGNAVSGCGSAGGRNCTPHTLLSTHLHAERLRSVDRAHRMPHRRVVTRFTSVCSCVTEASACPSPCDYHEEGCCVVSDGAATLLEWPNLHSTNEL